MHQEYLYDSVYKTLGPELIYNRIRWYGILDWRFVFRCIAYHGMEILWNDSHLWYDWYKYWYVVLAGMDSWNEELYL